MANSKRARNDENKPFIFLDSSTQAFKCPRRVAQSVSLPDIQNLQQERARKDAAHAESLEEGLREAAEEKQCAEVKSRVEQVLKSVTAAGYKSLFEFVNELLHIRDQQISSQVSRMLGRHGEEVLNSIRARQPKLANHWALNMTGKVLAKEGQWLAEYLRPEQGSPVSRILQNFSLERIITNVETMAPTLCKLLREIAIGERLDATEQLRKDRSLVRLHFLITFHHCLLSNNYAGFRDNYMYVSTNTKRTLE